MASEPFASRANYAKFLGVQYLFNRDIDALYADSGLQALLRGVAKRRSAGLIEAELADLGVAVPEASAPPAIGPAKIDLPRALGWLYVSEGSNPRAALLCKEAARVGLSDEHGARHPAPAAEGPAAHLREFTAAFDAIDWSEAEEMRAIDGARAAFARVHGYAEAAFA